MIKFLREKLKSRKYLLLIKKYTTLSKEFSNESRNLFIGELKKRGIIEKTANLRILYLRKSLGFGFASFLLLSSFTGGAIVYAQKQNVDYNHPLYPMKRLGENIQVRLAPPEEKPVIQDELAQKRLAEIKQLIVIKEEEIKLINSQKTEETKQTIEKIEKKEQEVRQKVAENSETLQQIEEEKRQAVEQIEQKREKEIEKIENENKTKTEELNNDFHETVNSVLKTIESSKKESEGENKTKNLCESLRKKIDEHEEVSRENDDWPDFKNKCGDTKEND